MNRYAWMMLCCLCCVQGVRQTTLGQKPELVVEVGHTRMIYHVAVSPDGKLLASASADTTIKLWDVGSGRMLRTLPGYDNVSVHSASFSTDGKLLASAGYDGVVRLWDVAAGRKVKSLYGHTGYVNTVKFSPDGRLLASGGGDGVITLWDASSGEQYKILGRHNYQVKSIAFSPDGRTLASAGVYDGVKVWDTSSGELINTLPGSADAVAFSPDGRTVASGGFKIIKLWDLVSGKIKEVSAHGGNTSSLEFSPDGATLFSSSPPDYAVKALDVASGEPPRELLKFKGNDIALTLFPDGRRIAFWGGTGILLWDTVAKKQLKSPRPAFIGNTGLRVLSPSGKNLATYSSDTDITFWGFTTGNTFRKIQKPKPPIYYPPLVFAPDGKTVAVGEKSAVKIFDVSSWLELRNLSGHASDIKSVAFSPNANLLASASTDYAVKLWDVTSGALLKTLEEHPPDIWKADVLEVEFSPDGKTLAAGTKGYKINLWEVESGRALKTLSGHGAEVSALVFSPDGRTLATAGWDGYVKLWDVATGQESKTLVSSQYKMHTMAFSRDGGILATKDMTRDYSVIDLWDVKTGKRLERLRADEPQTTSKVWSKVPDFYLKDYELITPDGRLHIRHGPNETIELHDFKTGEHLASLISLDEDGWVVATPDGRFDTNKLESPDGLHWFVPDAPLVPLSLDVFMRDYFEPNLLPRLLKCTEEGNCGREFKPIRDLSSLNRTQPKVEIKEVNRTASPYTVEVIVVAETVTSEYQKGADKKAMNSSVFDLRLFRAGQLVGHSTPDEKLQSTFRTYRDFGEELAAWRQANRVDLVEGKKTFRFEVRLPNSHPDDKQLEFSAYAFNDDRVKSETARATYTLPTNRESEPRRAYVVTFGVSRYDNREWDLQFASNDARAISETVAAHLRARKEFAEVVEVPLISESEVVANQTVERRGATKANIRTALELLAGKSPPPDKLASLEGAIGDATLRRILRARPDDLVLLAFSAHGYADHNGIFYVIPSDIGRESRKRVTTQVLERSISSDELTLWLRGVDAGEMVMIVDACHSATAVEGGDFKPGPMGSRGLGQLAFDKGMRILTATQADNIALENNLIRQGLLTYALVKDGIESRQADYRPKDKIINIREWLLYGVERVPKLYEEISAGNVRSLGGEPRKQTKIVLVTWGGNSISKDLEEVVVKSKTQQPLLFDFTHHRREVTLTDLR